MVDFKLTNKQLLAKKLFAEFAEKEIKPLSKEMDETEVFDLELLEKMKKIGLMGMKQEDIKAKYEDGILKLSVPKEEPKKVETTKHIAIEG